MKRLIASLLSVSMLLGGTAFAQPSPHRDHDRGRQNERGEPNRPNDRRPPRRGERLEQGRRGDRVANYKHHGLKKPPKGHEWRRVDDNYVLIAVATGVISSVILANR